MSYIKIFRLNVGYDLVSFFEQQENKIKLIHPLIVDIQINEKSYNEVILTEWIPKGICDNKYTIIDKKQILCTFNPNEQFKEYYLNFLNNFYSLEELSYKNIKSLLESLDAKVNNKIH